MQSACWKFLLTAIIALFVSPSPAILLAQADDEPETAPPVKPAITLEDSPLLKQPETPEENFAAVLMMVKLARPQLAKLYLEKVMTPKPT